MKRLVLMTGIVGVLLLGFNAGAGIVTTGLVSWWKCDDSTNPIADMQGANKGTYNGSLFQKPGHGNYALGLDGASFYIALTNNIDLPEITIEAWFNPSAAPATYYAGIFSNLDYTVDKGYLLTFAGTSYSILQFWVGNEYLSVTDTGITTGKWYHLVATYSNTATTAKIYINGVLKDTKTNFTAPAGYSGNTPELGKYGNNYLNGLIDDCRIYNRVLSAAEISQNYEAEEVK